MNVAIVGGSGTIGRHLAADLVRRGERVAVLSRDPDRVRQRVPEGVEIVRWSPNDLPGLTATLAGNDAIVNLAGAKIGPRPWTRRRRRTILGSRIDTTRAIVAALAALPAQSRPAVLVNASGTDTYAGLDDQPATEDSPTADGFLAEVCLAWEAEARKASELGLRVAIIRTGFVLAPGAPALRLLVAPFRVLLGGPIGSGHQWISWIHIDDVVGIYGLALRDARVIGIVNAVAPRPARQSEFAQAIGDALGRPSWLRVPALLIRLAMGEQSTLVLGSRRIVPARALELGYGFVWRDLPIATSDVLQS